jgi:hypothetical protein
LAQLPSIQPVVIHDDIDDDDDNEGDKYDEEGDKYF